MSIKGLKFSTEKTAIKLDKVQARRSRLIANLQKQKSLIEQEEAGEHPKGRWYWKSDDAYYLPVKFGKHPLEIIKGHFTIECEDFQGLKNAIGKTIEAVEEGYFDKNMEAASDAIRKRFHKSKSTN